MEMKIRTPWNKGKKLKPHSSERKRLISESMKGKNSGEKNGMFGKIPWNKGKPMQLHIKKALLKANLGSKHTPEHIKKIRDTHIGEKPYEMTDKTRAKQRVIRFKKIKEQKGLAMPCIGNNENEILTQIEFEFGVKLERQYQVSGYFLDGYSKKLNIAFEVDERGHKYNKEKDDYRERMIRQELNCEFIRIQDY